METSATRRTRSIGRSTRLDIARRLGQVWVMDDQKTLRLSREARGKPCIRWHARHHGGPTLMTWGFWHDGSGNSSIFPTYRQDLEGRRPSRPDRERKLTTIPR